jgi:predicted DNA-binding transcriptional regulator AlpA
MPELSEIIYVADVLAIVQVSRTKLYATLLKKLNFSRLFKIGVQRTAWFLADVEAWLNTRVSGVTI